MISPLFLNSDLDLDWTSLTADGIELDADSIDLAVQLSHSVSPMAQWQTYINALGLYGFEQWLAEWAPDLTLNYSQSTLVQPAYANLIEVTCNVLVNEFRLCLIMISDRADSIVECSKAALTLSRFIPDFYVLIEVLEEQMQVKVCRYQRRDQLLKYVQAQSISSSDWMHSLSLDWFNCDPTSLLLELRCLKPTTISQSEIPETSMLSVSQLQAQLTTLAPQLQPTATPLSHILTWQAGATLLSHPELVEQMYPSQRANTTTPAFDLDVASDLASSCMNVASWLHDRLDDIAQAMNWMLMPAFTPAVAGLRSDDPFVAIQTALAAKAMTIPAMARGAYQDVSIEPAPLRLYAVTWMMSGMEEIPEWTLLLVLGTVSGASLPTGTRLQVQSGGELLATQMANSTTPYLYIQVVGTIEEQFEATIVSSNETAHILPTFAFDLE